MAATRTYRSYDHRFRRLINETGDIELAIENGVPRSTARDWCRMPTPKVISLDVLSRSEHALLRRELITLRRQNAKLRAVLRLLLVLVKVCGVTLRRRRVDDATTKERILRAVERSCNVLSLRTSLRVLGLSPSRYHCWKRRALCELDDASSCPRTSPHQLTSAELETIKDMVTSEEYRHVPTGTLALLAQRLGRVFASASTWYRLVRRYRWRRPRRRVHPAGPTIGIRASKPNEVWHTDTTVIRLLDGSRAYLHAVADNFSRRILAWRVSERFDPANTLAVLLEAIRSTTAVDAPPTLLADAGVENVNSQVEDLIDSGALRRVLAMRDVVFSNSIIEAWWRSLKHQWLYLNTLDSVATVRRLVSFFVTEHNTRLPHSAFRGQTPDEVYFATGEHVPQALESKRQAARAARREANRAVACAACAGVLAGR